MPIDAGLPDASGKRRTSYGSETVILGKTWAKEILAIAQTGLAYARDVYDVERYQAVHCGGSLPELSEERNTKQQLQTLFEYLRNPEKPVILD